MRLVQLGHDGLSIQNLATTALPEIIQPTAILVIILQQIKESREVPVSNNLLLAGH
jgi:hypothetical protein